MGDAEKVVITPTPSIFVSEATFADDRGDGYATFTACLLCGAVVVKDAHVLPQTTRLHEDWHRHRGELH